jgi:hypothetical protein
MYGSHRLAGSGGVAVALAFEVADYTYGTANAAGVGWN